MWQYRRFRNISENTINKQDRTNVNISFLWYRYNVNKG